MVKLKDIDESVTPIGEIKEPEIRNRSKFSDALIAMAQQEKKTVKGRFRNFDKPGGMERIIQRKYPVELAPMFDKWMVDGEVYEIPLWVARWLNGTDISAVKLEGKINSCRYPIHEWKTTKTGEVPLAQSMDAKGVPTPHQAVPAKWERRFAFESLEFDTALA